MELQVVAAKFRAEGANRFCYSVIPLLHVALAFT